MSLRRGKTVSPLIGWPSNALPEAVQSLSVPSSKSRLSGWPSFPTGLVPGEAANATETTNAATQTVPRAKRDLNIKTLSQVLAERSRRITFATWSRVMPGRKYAVESLELNRDGLAGAKKRRCPAPGSDVDIWRGYE